MRADRTDYPKRKVQIHTQMQELPKKYKVTALVKMAKIRASQILPLRKKLKGEVEFVSIKNKVAKKALKDLDVPGIGMFDKLAGQYMFMFTDMSPFKLSVLLAKNRIMMPARAGDIASMDVVVPAKNTGIAPGPMLTEFKEAGIPTKIDQGTIWIVKDSVPVKKGEPINAKLAPLLGKLDIKPVEAKITLDSALEGGLEYTGEDLTVDVEGTKSEIARLHQAAVSLSIEAAYATPENAGQILARAMQHAVSLCMESAFVTDETREQILQKADAQARGLASKAKDYSPS